MTALTELQFYLDIDSIKSPISKTTTDFVPFDD